MNPKKKVEGKFPVDPELRKRIDAISSSAGRQEVTEVDMEKLALEETDTDNGGRRFGGE